MSQVQVDLTVIIYGNLIIKRCATKKNNVEHIDDNLSNVLEKSRITVKSTQTRLIKMTNNCQLNLFIEINPNFTVMCILVRTASFPWGFLRNSHALFQDSEETIHCAEKNDTSYERDACFL